MFDEKLPYFFSPASVMPRNEKYVLSLSYGGKGYHVRQLDATVEDKQKEKIRQTYFNNKSGWFDTEANWQHDSRGTEFK